MFCSECGTKVNDGAKFCFNCGAKILGAITEGEKTTIIEKEIPEEFTLFVERKYMEAYIEGKNVTADVFYKKAKFFEVKEEQVDGIVNTCKEKINKLEKFIASIYEECRLFELTEDEEDEIIGFGNSLGFDDEDVEGLIDYYDECNHIVEKKELYTECVLNYVSDGKTHIKRGTKVEEYQETVYKLFEKNILQMESFLKKQYKKTKDYELSQEQVELIYSEGDKLFPEETIMGIILSYDKKSGVLQFKEEKERQRALEHMTIFNLYGEQVVYTEEEGVGISIGKEYRKIFQRLSKELETFQNNTDRTKEGYWDVANEKILRMIDTIYRALVADLAKRGVSKQDISEINYMDVFKYWIPVFEDIDYQYNMICCGTEAAEYYRKLRKETRGRLIGGGFGLDGAIRGIATAGAINMMTGAAHSAFNFVGNLKSEWKKLQAIKELFGYSLKENVEVVFKKTLLWAYLTELEMLKRYNVSSKSFRLFYGENENASTASVKSLKENPFNEKIYENIIMLLGIDAEIDKLVKFTDIDIREIKSRRRQKEQAERTEDGIVFPSLADKEAYCKERDTFKTLLEDLLKLNIYANREEFDNKVNLLKKLQPQAIKYWKDEVSNALLRCEQKINDLDVPNSKYLSKILGTMPINVKSSTVIIEENEKYNYWVEQFSSVLKLESKERVVLFILDSDKNPGMALMLSTHHIYFYYISDKEHNIMSFDFIQISDLKYNVYEKDKLISKFDIIISNKKSINLCQLFSYKNTSNYSYSTSFYEALKACIEIGYKQKSMEMSQDLVQNCSKMSQQDKYKLAKGYLKGLDGLEKNEIIAVKLLEELVEEGHPEAQWTLGEYYFYYKLQDSFYSSFTTEEEQDRKNKEQQAFKLFVKAAEAGYPEAQNMLATFYSSISSYAYRHANGIAKDDKKAVVLFKKAVEQNNAAAKRNLAIHYFEGVGIEKNEQIALRLLSESAEQGDIDAQTKLAKRYKNGEGVKKSVDDAIYWYNRAAEKGDLQAKNELKTFKQKDISRVLSKRMAENNVKANEESRTRDIVTKSKVEETEKSLEEKQNIEKESKENEEWKERYDFAVLCEEEPSKENDIRVAVEIYEELAEKGIPQAQWRLGKCYNSGDGVEKDQKKAFELFEKAANKECVEAQSALGNFYSSLFSHPTKKDDQYAVELFIKAAEKGSLPAQCNLAIHYYKGLGVKEDKAQAIYWWTEAAKQGSAVAQYNLGQRYEYGEGVERSKEKALYWYDEAAKQGYEKAIDSAKKLQGGCYITTAVCQSFEKADDCYELQIFRKFRDEWLKYQEDGEELIYEYYKTAPMIVHRIKGRIDAKNIFENIWNEYLKECLNHIENQEYEKCKKLYMAMVTHMKENYMKEE